MSSTERETAGSFVEPLPPVKNVRNRRFVKGTKSLKKNLFQMGESDDETNDAIQVFLRLKPCPENMSNSLEVLDSRTLLAKVPQSIQDRKKFSKHENCKYTFSYIFGPDASQEYIFNKCISKSVKGFFEGSSSLLFTYGTTNAGKTFTVQGNANMPGIIPRVIAKLFKSIDGRQNVNSFYCPLTNRTVVELSENGIREMEELKNNIVSWDSEKSQRSSQSVKSKHGGASIASTEDLPSFSEMQHKLDLEVSGDQIAREEDEDTFSVWLSFAEIYNEGIYDLLEPTKDKKRQQLKLSSDSVKNVFIKNLKHVKVCTAIEADKVLRFGRSNLCFATTGMNDFSSRSHCIFSITLCRHTYMNNPEDMIISSLSICDLAGAERQRNALNIGDRLKESQNINTSLLVLNRCFNIIRENQHRVDKHRIPFRDSKLTQLFQNALTGNENITMIINVNPADELYEETQHVLKTSAIAQHIVFEPKPKVKTSDRKSIFSERLEKKKGTSIPWDPTAKESISSRATTSNIPTETETEQDLSSSYDLEYLLSFIEALQSKLKEERMTIRELKAKINTLDAELRQELTSQFAVMMQTMNDHYKENLKHKEEFQLELEKEKIKNVHKYYAAEMNKMRSRLNTLENNAVDSFGDNNDNEGLREQIKDLELQVEGMTDLINSVNEENSQLDQQVTSLKKECSMKDKENKVLKDSLKALQSQENERLVSKIEKLQKELEEQVKLKEEQFEEAFKEFLYEQQERKNAETELDKAKEELLERNNQIENLKSEIEGLDTLLNTKNDEIDQLNFQLQELAEKYKGFDELKSALQEELNTLKVRCQDQELLLEPLKLQHKDLSDQLLEKDETIKSLETMLQEMSVNYATLQVENVQISNKKCEECERWKIVHEEQLSEKNQEIKLLEEDMKDVLKRIQVLEQDIKEKCNETNLLQEKLKECVQAEMREKELEKQVAQKDQDIESLHSKLVAYETTATVMRSYSEEMENRNAEITILRQQNQDLSVTNQTLEQELQKFQTNQKLICARYEEQLRKRTEESEREKREAIALSNTLYKSTPTPKKDLQAEIERLKQELETEKASKNSLIKELSISRRKASSKENLDPEKCYQSKLEGCTKKGSSKSVSILKDASSDDEVFLTRNTRIKKSKNAPAPFLSARKTRGQKLKEANVNKAEDFGEENLETKRKPKRRLYNASQDNDTTLDSVELQQYIRQKSPGSAIKDALRSHRKL